MTTFLPAVRKNRATAFPATPAPRIPAVSVMSIPSRWVMGCSGGVASPRDWFRCTSEPHPRQGDSPSPPRCDSPGPVSPPLRLLVALTVKPDTGRGEQSSHPPCDRLRFARRGGRLAPSPGKAITGPGTRHHDPFGRIDVLKSPNGPWCLSRACLLPPGPAPAGAVCARCARRASGSSRAGRAGRSDASRRDRPRPQPAARGIPRRLSWVTRHSCTRLSWWVIRPRFPGVVRSWIRSLLQWRGRGWGRGGGGSD